LAMGAHRWLRFGDKLGSLITYWAGLLVIYVLRPFPHNLGAWAIVALIGGLIATSRTRTWYQKRSACSATAWRSEPAASRPRHRPRPLDGR